VLYDAHCPSRYGKRTASKYRKLNLATRKRAYVFVHKAGYSIFCRQLLCKVCQPDQHHLQHKYLPQPCDGVETPNRVRSKDTSSAYWFFYWCLLWFPITEIVPVEIFDPELITCMVFLGTFAELLVCYSRRTFVSWNWSQSSIFSKLRTFMEKNFLAVAGLINMRS
jgi:hypothetical protein